MNLPNRNPDTGVRYGYISANSLDPEVLDELQLGPQAVDVHWELAKGELIANYRYGNIDDGEDQFDDLEDEIDRRVEELANNWYDDEPIHEGKLDGVKYRTSWLGGALNVWVFYSPCVGFFQECSPCVPGAGNLDCPEEYGVACYNVPQAWRLKDA